MSRSINRLGAQGIKTKGFAVNVHWPGHQIDFFPLHGEMCLGRGSHRRFVYDDTLLSLALFLPSCPGLMFHYPSRGKVFTKHLSH
jgi:hypothetical protein